MEFSYRDSKSNAEFRLITHGDKFDRLFFKRDRKDKLLTIAWNPGQDQKITIDEVEYDFPQHSVLPLMVNQSFHFERPEAIIAWQFNRDFYCIVNHDEEVSCVGFIFYGSSQMMFIGLDEKDQVKLSALLQVFIDEFETVDNIQGDMLRMLLVRLIITITRLGKAQYIKEANPDDARFGLYRQFNILVENNYRTEHEVQFYASELNKSPKTLSNTFALYGQKSPIQIIQERVVLEAKRLFYYTDKSSKEIAADLGFEDASHFSRFFKNQTKQSPSEFKNAIRKIA